MTVRHPRIPPWREPPPPPPLLKRGGGGFKTLFLVTEGFLTLHHVLLKRQPLGLRKLFL